MDNERTTTPGIDNFYDYLLNLSVENELFRFGSISERHRSHLMLLLRNAVYVMYHVILMPHRYVICYVMFNVVEIVSCPVADPIQRLGLCVIRALRVLCTPRTTSPVHRNQQTLPPQRTRNATL